MTDQNFDHMHTETISKTNNLFDILDDESDLTEYTKAELDIYFQTASFRSTHPIDDDDDDDFSGLYSLNLSNLDTDRLSQKLSQLSTQQENPLESNSTHTYRSPFKRSSCMQLPLEKKKYLDMDKLPAYLSYEHPRFQFMIQINRDIVDSIDNEDLQRCFYYQHQIGHLHIQQEVFLVYMKSGNGTLDRTIDIDLGIIDRCFWPEQVLKHMFDGRPTTISEVAMDDDSCRQFVRQRLQDIDQQLKTIHEQYESIRQQYTGWWTSNIDSLIDRYVHQYGIQPLQMKRDLKIALLRHDFRAKILERYYTAQNPDEYQILVAKRLCEMKTNAEKARRDIIELKQRVFFGKPPSSMDTMDNEGPISSNQQERLIQQKKLDNMIQSISRVELLFCQTRRAFELEWTKAKEKGMTTSLLVILERRFINVIDKLRDIYQYRIDYNLRTSYADDDENGNDQTKKTRITFGPSLIIDTMHDLNEEQRRLLNRGPTYVPPCQMYSALDSTLTMDDLIKKQYTSMQHQLAKIFAKYQINIALTMDINKNIQQQFKKHFSLHLPVHLQQRAIEEKKLVESIRITLKEQCLILRRTADRCNQFYLGDATLFDIGAENHLNRMDTHEFIVPIDIENADEQIRIEVSEMIYSINEAIKLLEDKKAISRDLANRLHLNPLKVKLSYLYFLPDITENHEISFVPRIMSKQSATSTIAKYLERILRPFVNSLIHSTTFHSEHDFIQKLYHYTYTQQRFKSSTVFCSLSIKNYYHLLSHTSMKEVASYILHEHLPTNRLDQITINTILNLLHLYLYNNHFFYKDKIYTMTKGSPSTIPLSETLASMYVHEWQRVLLREVERERELFGRYKDQIFFTWNGSLQSIEQFIQKLQQQHPNVQFQYKMGSSVEFFGAFLENREGQLYSCVAHRSTIQRYTLPYVARHSKCEHSDWLRLSLNRAVCYCSSVDDFHRERIYLELTFLTNGYSLLFVETHVQHFFEHFHGNRMQYSRDPTMYHSFRSQWFDLIEKQNQPKTRWDQSTAEKNFIQLQYSFEYGPRCQFNRCLQELWWNYFQRHPALSKEHSVTLITTQHQFSLNVLLAKYRSDHH